MNNIPPAPLYGFQPTQATMASGQGLLGGIGQETLVPAPPQIATIAPPELGGMGAPQAAAQSGGNMMAGPSPEEPSKASGAISGAAQGASIGAMTGNPYAIAAGAIIGGAIGLFGS